MLNGTSVCLRVFACIAVRSATLSPLGLSPKRLGLPVDAGVLAGALSAVPRLRVWFSSGHCCGRMRDFL